MTSDALTESTPFLTTDGEIARANLESARGRSWSRFFADPVQTRAIEAVLEHEQLTAQFVGEVSALDRVAFLAAELATVDAASAPSALIQARVASMLHRFAEARDILAQAEIGGAPKSDIDRLRSNIDQACGTNLNAVLDARRKFADGSHELPDQVALGSLLADMGDFTAADQTYREGLRAYQDVSPFPVAWTCFQLGILWGEQMSEPDQSCAAEWYRRAIEVLPSYTKARVHLAEIYASSGRLSEAETLLVPAVSSGDPEVYWRLAEVTALLGRSDESETHMQAARTGYEDLLARHLLAFADHGAEFYAGSGNDLRRALELARVNIANRPTLRAFELGYAMALSGGDDSAASEFLAGATKRWGSTAAFRQSSLARHRVDRLEGAAA